MKTSLAELAMDLLLTVASSFGQQALNDATPAIQLPPPTVQTAQVTAADAATHTRHAPRVSLRDPYYRFGRATRSEVRS